MFLYQRSWIERSSHSKQILKHLSYAFYLFLSFAFLSLSLKSGKSQKHFIFLCITYLSIIRFAQAHVPKRQGYTYDGKTLLLGYIFMKNFPLSLQSSVFEYIICVNNAVFVDPRVETETHDSRTSSRTSNCWTYPFRQRHTHTHTHTIHNCI